MTLDASRYLIFEKKDYIRRIPVSRLENYDDSSKEMAIVIPLRGTPLPKEDAFSDKYVYSAIACVRSLMTNTDIVERKIPVYFFVDDTIPATALHILLEYGVNVDRILFYSRGECLVERFWSGTHFQMLSNETLTEYEYLVRFDADLFACCDPRIRDTFSTHIFQSHQIAPLFYTPSCQSYIDFPAWFHRWDNSLDDVAANWERTKTALTSVTDMKVDWNNLSSVSGGVISYPMERLPEGFVEFCQKLSPVIGSEELILSLWCQHTHSDLDNLSLTPLISHFCHVADQRKLGAYWAHLYVTDDWDDKESEALMHKDMGVAL